MTSIRDLIKKESFDVKDYTIILSTRNHTHLGQIKNVTDINYNAPMASAKELSFTVHWSEETIMSEYYDMLIKEEIDEETVKSLIQAEKDIWNQIEDLKLVWVKELNEYFEIKVTYTDAADTIKAITATSACEAELGQLNVYNTEINTDLDIEREDYEVTIFYNEENHKASLLHRILSDKAPHYSIKHVDESLKKIQRSFSIDGTSIYDFLTGECAEQFNCLFVFNSVERSISVYDLYTVCQNDECGYRGEYIDKCPKCGNTNLKYFGEDTTIYIDKENLTEEVVFETDTDSIKNCLKLEAGDDDMTATVRALNQNGTDYIYYISEQQKKDMPKELVKKLEDYDVLFDSYTEEYQGVLAEEYEAINKIHFYTSSMMPEVTNIKVEVTAKTEADKLTQANLSPLGLSKVNSSTSRNTVESSLLNYARVFARTGYVKVEINESEFIYNSTKGNCGTWKGNLKVTNYSDKEDIAYSPVIQIEVHENYQQWLEQKVKRALSLEEDKDGSIFDVLSIETLAKFKSALQEYCLNRLTSFKDAIQSALDVLVQQKQGSKDATFYDALYKPYYDKLQACEEEINARAKTIDSWNIKKTEAETKRIEIQDKLNFEDNLGEYYEAFCAYRREDKYSNTNFISDGFEDPEIFEKAKEFLETAKKELEKSATRQHSISTTLQNLLLIPEFEPLLDKFKLGNWIRVGVGNDVYRLRLIKYGINLSDLSKIDVEFSDLTKTSSVVSDVKSIIDSAQSMASSYSYVSKQASKGDDAQTTIKDWVKEGLNSAQVALKNNDTEDVTIDRHGILCKSLDESTEKFSPKQLRLTGNILAFTDDNWETIKTALGEHDYVFYDENKKDFDTRTGYGLSSEFVQSAHIYGSHMIAGDIRSRNYSSTEGTYINLDDGTFSFGGGRLSWDNSTLQVTGKVNITNGGKIGTFNVVQNDNYSAIYSGTDTISSNTVGIYLGTDGIRQYKSDTANVTIKDGVLTANGASITGNISASSGTISGNLEIVGGSLFAKDSSEKHLVTLRGVQSNVGYGVFYITDKSDGTTKYPFIVNGDGSFTATNANITGKITSTSGKIGGFSIDSEGMYNGTWGTDGSVMMCVGTANTKTIAGKSSNGWCFTAGSKFGVTKSGDLYATSANITGKITSSSGNIGGFDISSTYLQTTNEKVGIGTSADWSFWAGYNKTTGACAFKVKQDGSVSCTNLSVTGGSIKLGDVTINSDGIKIDGSKSSSIAGWKIYSNRIAQLDTGNSIPVSVGMSCDYGNYAFWAGGQNASGQPSISGSDNESGIYHDVFKPAFAVRQNGELIATKGKFGDLTIQKDGSIGAGGGLLIYPKGITYTSFDGKYFMAIDYNGKLLALRHDGVWIRIK